MDTFIVPEQSLKAYGCPRDVSVCLSTPPTSIHWFRGSIVDTVHHHRPSVRSSPGI